MELNTGKAVYDETDVEISHQVTVNDPGKFIEAMLRLFVDRGTLYISSYDFGYWANELKGFRSGDRVRLETSLPEPAFLADGFSVTDDFIYVFLMNCLKNIDPRSVFNQFLIYEMGAPLVQCCSNFEDVYINIDLPQSVLKELTENNIISIK